MEAAISTALSTTPALLLRDVGIVLLVFAGVVLLWAAVRLVRLRLRARQETNRELPPLIYPARRIEIEPRRPAPAAEGTPGDEVTYHSAAQAGPSVRLVSEPVDPPVFRDVVPSSNGHAHAAEDGAATLQLLPGRLEALNPGMDQEIRFVRIPGVSRFTFGRNPGPAHTHIQLNAATASRMHAYMAYESGRWRLGNLSLTNSVVVNGTPLGGETVRLLEDGDRIEFGELTFVFRER